MKESYMHLILLALMAFQSPQQATAILNRVAGLSLMALAEAGVPPERLASRIAHPDRAVQRPDPIGSMLTFRYDRFGVLLVWELRNTPGNREVPVLRWTGWQ
jgi:hypothetical protein